MRKDHGVAFYSHRSLFALPLSYFLFATPVLESLMGAQYLRLLSVQDNRGRQLHLVAFIPLVVGVFGAIVLTPVFIFIVLRAAGFSDAGPVAGKGRIFSYATVPPCRTFFLMFPLPPHFLCCRILGRLAARI